MAKLHEGILLVGLLHIAKGIYSFYLLRPTLPICEFFYYRGVPSLTLIQDSNIVHINAATP
jgi:hypothetical protein